VGNPCGDPQATVHPHEQQIAEAHIQGIHDLETTDPLDLPEIAQVLHDERPGSPEQPRYSMTEASGSGGDIMQDLLQELIGQRGELSKPDLRSQSWLDRHIH